MLAIADRCRPGRDRCGSFRALRFRQRSAAGKCHYHLRLSHSLPPATMGHETLLGRDRCRETASVLILESAPANSRRAAEPAQTQQKKPDAREAISRMVAWRSGCVTTARGGTTQ